MFCMVKIKKTVISLFFLYFYFILFYF